MKKINLGLIVILVVFLGMFSAVCATDTSNIEIILDESNSTVTETNVEYAGISKIYTVKLFDTLGNNVIPTAFIGDTKIGTVFYSSETQNYIISITENHSEIVLKAINGAVSPENIIDNYGDVTGDGLVDGNDEFEVALHSAELAMINDEKSAIVSDVNFDGVIDGNDEFSIALVSAELIGSITDPAKIIKEKIDACYAENVDTATLKSAIDAWENANASLKNSAGEIYAERYNELLIKYNKLIEEESLNSAIETFVMPKVIEADENLPVVKDFTYSYEIKNAFGNVSIAPDGTITERNIGVGLLDHDVVVTLTITINNSSVSKDFTTKIMHKEIEENVFTITSDQFYSINKSTLAIEYLENPTDSKTKTITLSPSVVVYKNGVMCTSFTANDFSYLYGEISFAKLNTETSEIYDAVYISDFTNFVIDTNNTNTYRLKFKNRTGTIIYDPEDESIYAKLYDENGNEMAWEDLAEWDVISCKTAEQNGTEIIIGYKQVNNVTGTVTNITDENSSYAKYKIDEKEYMICPHIDPIPTLGDKGTFFLDIMGKICSFKKEKVIPDYGYIIEMTCSDSDTSGQIKLLTADGIILSYNTSPLITVDGVKSIPAKEIFCQNYLIYLEADETAELLKKHNDDNYVIKNSFGSEIITEVNVIESNKLIIFKTNDANEICEIDRPFVSHSIDPSIAEHFREYASGKNGEYNLNSKKITYDTGSVYLNDSTIIMVTGETDEGLTNEEKCKIYTITQLNNGQPFNNFSVYNVNEDKIASLILVESDFILKEANDNENEGSEENDSPSDFVAVLSVQLSVNEATDEENYTFYGFLNTEEVPYVTKDTSCMPRKGSVIIPKYTSIGEVESFDTVVYFEDDIIYANVDFMKNTNTAQASKEEFAFGDVTDISRREVTIGNMLTENPTDSKNISVTSKTNVYIYDKLPKERIITGETFEFSIEYNQNDSKSIYYGNEKIKDLFAVARLYNGDVTDLIFYIVRK